MQTSQTSKELTEEEVKTRIITPTLQKVGWSLESIAQERTICQNYEFTDGAIYFQGTQTKRKAGKKYDYCLQTYGLNLAIIEAKKSALSAYDGMQQAMEYAIMLKAPFAYSSNGEMFIEHDFFTGKERQISIECFPSPEELYNRYIQGRKIPKDKEQILQTPFYLDKDNPRYYQVNAVNATLEAIAKGQDRILLVMATGTGKTFTSFQIIFRLFHAKIATKILYLADRNNLIDQTMDSTFFQYFKDKRKKIEHKKLDPSYNLYFSLYQQFISYEEDESGNAKPIHHYKDFAKDFFDLIIIDECHRGSVRADSEWREILEYFSPAIQIGMTATPKYDEEENDNIDYFKEPVYVYSLKQGIEDGFLAPYKVIRYGINIDLDGYRPEFDKRDKQGELVPDKTYMQSDFDREIIIDERTKLVAKTISDFLKFTLKDRFAKTIVFCQDTFHAGAMREALINENADLIKQNSHYIVRITGNDDIGKSLLGDFIDRDKTFPVIATTSKLLTTGADTKLTKVIAIDANISSITEFKQIIGRGTRIDEKLGKCYFVILDFRNATRHFSNNDFDPSDFTLIEKTIKDNETTTQTSEEYSKEFPTTKPKLDDTTPAKKIQINGVDVRIINETHQIIDSDGKLISSDFKSFSKNNLTKNYQNLELFLKEWNANERKTDFLQLLEQKGILIEELRAMREFSHLDEFDILLSLAFNQAPLSRKERAKKANKFLSSFEGKAREVLEILLDKYAQNGITEIESAAVFKNEPFTEDITQILDYFGGVQQYMQILSDLKKELYEVA